MKVHSLRTGAGRIVMTLALVSLTAAFPLGSALAQVRHDDHDRHDDRHDARHDDHWRHDHPYYGGYQPYGYYGPPPGVYGPPPPSPGIGLFFPGVGIGVGIQ